MIYRIKVRFRGNQIPTRSEISDLITTTTNVAPLDVVLNDDGLPQLLFSSAEADSHLSTMKVTFTSPEEATSATTNGFRCFGLACTPRQITREHYYQLRQCFKCYSYEHFTKSCPSQDQRCSKCAESHHFKQCTSDFLKCLLCQGHHTAVSAECPNRRQEIQKMTEARQANTTRREPSTFNVQAANFPLLPGGGGASAQTASHWGPGSQPANQSSTQQQQPQLYSAESTSQPSPHQMLLPNRNHNVIMGLIRTAEMIAGTNTKEF
ncbi:uncharacterized protein, partial [Procambarus clarkii]|uniref:uncharacterized protein n=1 Tax=Procambarus clarkii TaxID=6728 RepID=UPI0037428158